MKLDALRDWAEAASADGWLDASALASIQKLETQEAEQLFINQGQRPLLIAFFGGTGAGKSSLLNRLAGSPIARAGLERPTSYEVSLYLHQDFQDIQLPAELPLERTRIAWHQDAKRRLLAWIDMPDFDSTASENRALVEAWLPYIDWVIFVVTPERYKDALGWQFLLERREKHQWCFVMNHWDQGQAAQLEDLRSQLEAKGFTQAQILRTACISPPIADDFTQLEASINQAIETFGLQWLQAQGLRARAVEMQQLANDLVLRMGTQERWLTFQTQAMDDLDPWLDGLEQQIRADSERLCRRQISKNTEVDALAHQIASLLEDLPTPAIYDTLAEPGTHWVNLAFGHGVPSDALHMRLAPTDQWLAQLRAALKQGLETAIARPGSRLRRGLVQLTHGLGWLLPLSGAGWVSWELVQGYYLATQGQQDFVGINFAIHSSLLLAAAWFVPRLVEKHLTPKAPQVMRQGIDLGLAAFRTAYMEATKDLWDRLEQARTQHHNLLKNLSNSQH